MLHISSLVFNYPDTHKSALSGVSIDVAKGQLFGLLGPNGAGKTTLLSVLSGQLSCPANSVHIEGTDLSKHAAPSMSLVPQEYAFYEQLSVAENLRFFCKVQSIVKSVQQERIDDVVAITQLQDYLPQRACHLSGGLKRRLNIAIGLLNKPSLLLLDEPTVGIDPHSRRFILDAIKRLNKTGTTVIYSTHYMEEVEFLCDSIAIIDHGKVIANGPLTQLLEEQGKHKLSINLNTAANREQLNALDHDIHTLLLQSTAENGNDGHSESIKRTTYSVTNDSEPLSIRIDCPRLSLYQITALLEQNGFDIAQLHYGSNNLEALFMQLTQRSLRD